MLIDAALNSPLNNHVIPLNAGMAKSDTVSFSGFRVPKEHLEAETGFLVNISDLMKAVDFKTHTRKEIVNTYLSKDYILYALNYLQTLKGPNYHYYSASDFNRCRLRRDRTIFPGKGKTTEYEVALKSRKDVHGACRIEISGAMNKKLYQAVKEHAANSKIRDGVVGHLLQHRFPERMVTASGIEIALEIDFIREAGVGKNFQKYRLADFPYAIVGCEIIHHGSEEIYQQGLSDLYGGRHAVSYLRDNSIPIAPNRALKETVSKFQAAKTGLKVRDIYDAIAAAA